MLYALGCSPICLEAASAAARMAAGASKRTRPEPIQSYASRAPLSLPSSFLPSLTVKGTELMTGLAGLAMAVARRAAAAVARVAFAEAVAFSQRPKAVVRAARAGSTSASFAASSRAQPMLRRADSRAAVTAAVSDALWLRAQRESVASAVGVSESPAVIQSSPNVSSKGTEASWYARAWARSPRTESGEMPMLSYVRTTRDAPRSAPPTLEAIPPLVVTKPAVGV